VNVNTLTPVALAYVPPTTQKAHIVVAPAIKLSCNPGTCVGYQGVKAGGVGSLSITSAPQNGAYVLCAIQVDNEKPKSIPCDKNLSELVSNRKVGTHTPLLLLILIQQEEKIGGQYLLG